MFKEPRQTSPMWTSSLLEGRQEKRLHCRWRPRPCSLHEHVTLPTITCKLEGGPLSMCHTWNEYEQIQWFQQRQGTGLSLGPRSGFSVWYEGQHPICGRGQSSVCDKDQSSVCAQGEVSANDQVSTQCVSQINAQCMVRIKAQFMCRTSAKHVTRVRAQFVMRVSI